MQLRKRDVVDAATAILDNHGITDLTMRRLARELNVVPSALYWHFANKQQLLGAVADRVLTPAVADVPGVDWRARVTTVCARTRDALLSHTDGAELVSASFAGGQSAGVARILQLLAGASAEAGLPGRQRELAARAIVHYVLGAAADEQSRLQWDAAGALAESVLDPTAEEGGGFEFGLRLLIDGLALHSGSSGHSRQSRPDRMLGPLVAVPPA